MSTSKQIMFVCTGNTCRSPMAAAIFSGLLGETDFPWQISSAGVHAAVGAPATAEAKQAMADLGLSLDEHEARQFGAEIVQDTDLILTMTRAHKQWIIDEFPHLADGVFTVKEFGGQIGGSDIGDPFGRGLKVYRETAKELQQYLQLVFARLQAERSCDE